MKRFTTKNEMSRFCRTERSAGRREVATSVRILLFLLLLESQSAFALDPRKTITQYSHEQWTNQKGLPDEAVYEIAQTPDGYLWLRTSSGLIRFDGVRFTRAAPKIGNDPLQEAIKAIGKNVDGHLLIRSETRTLLYRDGVFSIYVPPTPLPAGAVLKLFETSRREVWIGAENFVYAVRDGGVTEVLRNASLVTAFLEDRRGTLWIGTFMGLFKYGSGGFTHYSAGFRQTAVESGESVKRLPWFNGEVTALAEDRQGALWVGARNGLYKIVAGKPVADSTTRQFAGRYISAILPDRDGNMWIGTNASGIHLVTQGGLRSFAASDGLSDNSVVSFYEDREGSVWVGTKSGLDRFRNAILTPLTTKEGLVHNNSTSILEARDGSLNIFSDGGGLTRLKGGVARSFSTNEGLASNYGASLFESRDGSLWIGADHGLSRLKDGKITTYQAGGRLSKSHIFAIAEDEESLLFSTCEPQVFRFKDGKISELTFQGRPNPLAGLYVFTISRDRDGDLWFGASQGLFRLSRGKTPARMPIDFSITSIHDDERGNLWLGGKTPGLVRFRLSDGRITRYTAEKGLFDNEVLRVLSDERGDLWMSTPRGIFTVRRQDLDQYADGRIAAIRSVSYGTADGMKTTECSGQAQPSGWRGRDGKLWFTTHKGVVAIDPNRLSLNEVIPPVAIEEILADQEPLPALASGAYTELAPGKKRFEFHYNGLSLLIPERVRFKYRLEGYDRDWIDAGTHRVAYYTNLPPGKYRFRVIAGNSDGVWNEIGAAREFYLKPYFYQRSWFYLFCATFVAGVGWVIHQVRVGQMKARFSAVLAERRRIANDLHDTVEQGLSMILLHLESGRSKLPESPQAAEQHFELARRMVKLGLTETRRSVMESYSQGVENLDLGAAVSQLVEHLTAGTAVRARLQVDGASRSLSAAASHHLLLICREAVTNALKHARPTQILIDLRFEPKRVRLSVQDDGCGFDPDVPLHLGRHFGLICMRERSRKLGGELTLKSRPGSGTAVTLSVPIGGQLNRARPERRFSTDQHG